MTAQKILETIESVSPEDTAKMDEIDARVWCFLENKEFVEYCPPENMISECRAVKWKWQGQPDYMREINGSYAYYTRSRDALKAIRPKRWAYQSQGYESWSVRLRGRDTPLDETLNRPEFIGRGKTEELAELHAIIQVIEWERNHGSK